MEFAEHNEVEFYSEKMGCTVRGSIQTFNVPATMAWVRCVDDDLEFSHNEWVDIDDLTKV